MVYDLVAVFKIIGVGVGVASTVSPNIDVICPKEISGFAGIGVAMGVLS